MPEQLSKTVFESDLSDEIANDLYMSKPEADALFLYFQTSPLFIWNDIHNCEDRAEAIAILLNHWGIPHYKGWVFSGFFLKNETGTLANWWNYHVAAILPVKENNSIVFYVIDPAHSQQLETLAHWSEQVTLDANSYHIIKWGNAYIFPTGKIKKSNWHLRNKQNLKWTMQGLAGINGVSITGKAQVAFNKFRVKRTIQRFTALKAANPFKKK